MHRLVLPEYLCPLLSLEQHFRYHFHYLAYYHCLFDPHFRAVGVDYFLVDFVGVVRAYV